MTQVDFVGSAKAVPAGFSYQPEFLNLAEESVLLKVMDSLPFTEAEYREWRAKRRIVSYGGRYDFTHHALGIRLARAYVARIHDEAQIAQAVFD